MTASALRSLALRWRAAALPLAGTRTLPIVFGLLLLAVAEPLFAVPIPPLADYVNHLARMYVLAWRDADPILNQLYSVQWQIIPNLMMDAIVPTLVKLAGVIAAGRMFIVLTIFAMVTGPMAIHRALFGRLSLLPLVAFPFVYNGIFLFGLMNYLIGIGIALWGIAAWIAMRDRAPWQRLGLAAVIVVALFFCHMFAVGFFGMAVMGIELHHWASGRDRSPLRLARSFLPLALPFLPIIPLLLASPTMGLSRDILWESHGKVDGLYTIFQLYGDVPDLIFASVVIGGGVWLGRRGLLSLHPAGWFILVLGGLIFLAMPRMLFGSWLADQRMPIGVVFMVIGFLRPMVASRVEKSAFLAVLLGVTVFRVAEVQTQWERFGVVFDGIRQSSAYIPAGSSVLVAHADVPVGDERMHDAISHAPCAVVFQRDALVSTIFSVRGKQILDIPKPYRGRVDAEDGDPPTVSQMLASSEDSVAGNPRYWDRWPEKYDFVYVLYTSQEDDNPDPDHLSLVTQGKAFQLYAVRKGE